MAVVVGGSGVVWLAGVLGGLLSGSGAVLLGAGDAGSVLARLLRHLGHPAAAWPATPVPWPT